MREEDGLPTGSICEEAGVCHNTFYRWLKAYRKSGRTGLESNHTSESAQPHPAISEKIISVKKDHPTFGVRRIAAAVQRWFLLPASKHTVGKVLAQEGLQSAAPRARHRNVAKPRRFERSTPNQMWQSDIMMFRMGGRQVYIIGYIDDYSRYITGMSLCMVQSADNVLQLYRQATAEYGVPKEMLTDNGRQYVNWRGISKFQAELQKDRVKHIRSSPHHPMTLGKIERFWQTIFEEFLSRAQFESFENAQERVRLWVQYYNHKRPHQGIESLCPADRYFEIAGEVRKTIESGVKDNALELALRGKPREPFYLVGRMDGQAVVLRAQKGRLKLTLDDGLKPSTEEHEFTIDKENNDARTDHENDTICPTGKTPTTQPQHPALQREDESRGSAEDLGGAQHALTSMPGAGGDVEYIKSMAAAGHGGDAASLGAPGGAGQGPCAQPSPAGFAQQQTDHLLAEEIDPAAATAGTQRDNGSITHGCTRAENAGASCGDLAGAFGPVDGSAGCRAPEHITQELLRVAGPGADGNARCVDRSKCRPTTDTRGYTEAGSAGEGSGSFRPTSSGTENHRGEEHPDRLRSAAEIALRRFQNVG
jgi:transposase InsO family protein